MADNRVGGGDGSPEAIAYKLWELMRTSKESKDSALDLFAECLNTVLHPDGRLLRSRASLEQHYGQRS